MIPQRLPFRDERRPIGPPNDWRPTTGDWRRTPIDRALLQKTFTWNVRYFLGSSRIAFTSCRVSTSIWLLLLYSAGSLNSIPAVPSPFSSRVDKARRLLFFSCALLANSLS